MKLDQEDINIARSALMKANEINVEFFGPWKPTGDRISLARQKQSVEIAKLLIMCEGLKREQEHHIAEIRMHSALLGAIANLR